MKKITFRKNVFNKEAFEETVDTNFTQLKSTITRITNKTLKRLRKSFRNGEITEQQYYYNGWNEVWNEFSKSKYKDNFKYNVQ